MGHVPKGWAERAAQSDPKPKPKKKSAAKKKKATS